MQITKLTVAASRILWYKTDFSSKKKNNSILTMNIIWCSWPMGISLLVNIQTYPFMCIVKMCWCRKRPLVTWNKTTGRDFSTNSRLCYRHKLCILCSHGSINLSWNRVRSVCEIACPKLQSKVKVKGLIGQQSWFHP